MSNQRNDQIALLIELLEMNVIVNTFGSLTSKATVKYAFGRMNIASRLERVQTCESHQWKGNELDITDQVLFGH